MYMELRKKNSLLFITQFQEFLNEIVYHSIMIQTISFLCVAIASVQLFITRGMSFVSFNTFRKISCSNCKINYANIPISA